MGKRITNWLLKHGFLKRADEITVTNGDIIPMTLEGAVLKTLYLPANESKIIKGPIPQLNHATHKLDMYRADEIVMDMIAQYALGRQPGVNMTLAQARIAADVFFQIRYELAPLKWWFE